jgi:hypothetical protein
MKIRLSRKLRQMASALLIVMVLGGILCLCVMYYLSLIDQQNRLSVRSQAWNIAVAVSEAGIEEGLQVLNTINRTNISPSDLGWYFDGSMYWRTNRDASLGENWYTVGINLANPSTPQITSRAYVALTALAQMDSAAFFASVGFTASPGMVTRAVRVNCSRGNLFLASMVAKHGIDLKGNGVFSDSFDSGDLWKSNFGRWDPAVAGDRGDIASNDGVVSSISIGNANIYGKAHTGPEGTVTVGSQGAVGSHTWQDAGNKGFQDGWVLQDANFTFPETDFPYASGLPLGGPQTIVTVTYQYSKTATNSTTYPNPPPWSGVFTNTTYSTDSAPPSPPRAGTVTNTIVNQSSSLPSPIPLAIITNTVPDTSSRFPTAGTYVPPVERDDDHDKTHYHYDRITGYTWTTRSYTWPNYSYTYNRFTTNAIYATNYYDHVINTGDYYVTGTLSGSTIVLGDARLVLPAGLSMSGNDTMIIANDARLQMYAGGSSCTIGGNGIINKGGYAANLTLICAPSVTSFTLNGNGEFTGVLVAPEASLTMNGGGSGDDNFTGAVMVNSVRMNGHFSFHYDEALARMQGSGRMLVTSWDEIP